MVPFVYAVLLSSCFAQCRGFLVYNWSNYLLDWIGDSKIYSIFTAMAVQLCFSGNVLKNSSLSQFIPSCVAVPKYELFFLLSEDICSPPRTQLTQLFLFGTLLLIGPMTKE